MELKKHYQSAAWVIAVNSKCEYRNSKQISNSNMKMTKTKGLPTLLGSEDCAEKERFNANI